MLQPCGWLTRCPAGAHVIFFCRCSQVFHSDDARKQLKDLCVGTLAGYTGPADAALKGKSAGSATSTSSAQGTSPMIYLVAAAAVGALVYVFVL